MSDITIQEMWDLQEDLFNDPRLPEILKTVSYFPKPKARAMTDKEHLINIIWGVHMEQIVIDALKDWGVYLTLIDPENHNVIGPMSIKNMEQPDVIVNSDIWANILGGDKADIKAWNGFKSYMNPQWTSKHPTIDLVLRCESGTASIYMTGVRDAFLDPEGCKKTAHEAWHFEFTPEDQRIFDYKQRMRALL